MPQALLLLRREIQVRQQGMLFNENRLLHRLLKQRYRASSRTMRVLRAEEIHPHPTVIQAVAEHVTVRAAQIKVLTAQWATGCPATQHPEASMAEPAGLLRPLWVRRDPRAASMEAALAVEAACIAAVVVAVEWPTVAAAEEADNSLTIFKELQ
jgi:hypothetical protein